MSDRKSASTNTESTTGLGCVGFGERPEDFRESGAGEGFGGEGACDGPIGVARCALGIDGRRISIGHRTLAASSEAQTGPCKGIPWQGGLEDPNGSNSRPFVIS